MNPIIVAFKDPTHLEVDWANADLILPEFVIYSPEEQVGRSESQPGTIYWMSRTVTESSDTFRIGFASPVCDDPNVIERDDWCWTFTREPQPLVAEMTCKLEYLPAR